MSILVFLIVDIKTGLCRPGDALSLRTNLRYGSKNGTSIKKSFVETRQCLVCTGRKKSVPAIFERVRINYAFSCNYVGNANEPEHQLFTYNERVKEGIRFLLDFSFLLSLSILYM